MEIVGGADPRYGPLVGDALSRVIKERRIVEQQRVNRRQFIQLSAGAGAGLLLSAGSPAAEPSFQTHSVPWYRRVLRWGQTNINELDPTRYDINFWLDYWKR